MIELLMILFAATTLVGLFALGCYIQTKEELEQVKQKKCKIPEYAFKCSNCHCDELNRGR
jgi:outer membrane lipoprotein-sorting protein